MTDDHIRGALDEVGAAWLMDDDDEMCQANALRHLVVAAETAACERLAQLVYDTASMLRAQGHPQAAAILVTMADDFIA